MPSIKTTLVGGMIPAGQACPFLKTCAMCAPACPTKKTPKGSVFSCMAARAHSHLLISDNSLLRKIFYKENT
jgi:hypothetical protein